MGQCKLYAHEVRTGANLGNLWQCSYPGMVTTYNCGHEGNIFWDHERLS